jgi:hypothetical protein
MNHKIRSTMAGLFVAFSFALGGSMLGEAPVHAHLADEAQSNASGADASVTTPSESHHHDQRVRRHINMPYFSFGNVFPK